MIVWNDAKKSDRENVVRGGDEKEKCMSWNVSPYFPSFFLVLLSTRCYSCIDMWTAFTRGEQAEKTAGKQGNLM